MKLMYGEIFKLIMLTNSLFIVFISIYLIFSKKNEPSEYADKFSKTYVLKPRKKIQKF